MENNQQCTLHSRPCHSASTCWWIRLSSASDKNTLQLTMHTAMLAIVITGMNVHKRFSSFFTKRVLGVFILKRFTRHSCTGRYCWERVLATGILSVCLYVTTRYGFNARSDRDSGSSPYGSLEHLVSYDVIWWHWVRRFPSNEGIKEEYSPAPLEIVILPLLARLAWTRLQIDKDLLRMITSTAEELSSGTNIDDFERPWTPKIGVLVNF